MEEKQETPESDQEELDFDQDALDRWQDDGGPVVYRLQSPLVWK
jgi:hypothetical protein